MNIQKALAALAVMTIMANVASADDLSASLSGGGQGVASIQTLNASNLNYAIFADVGTITSAQILQGQAVVINLGGATSSFTTGSATGDVAAITTNPANYSVRVQGTNGTATGSLVFAKESGDSGGGGPIDTRIDTGNTSPCGQNGNGCALDNQYDVSGELVDQQGVVKPATFISFTSDTVLAHVFGESNLEFLVKVLDTCDFADVRWIFAGGATDLAGKISVREVSTGLAREYSFGAGRFVAINDTVEGQPCPEN